MLQRLRKRHGFYLWFSEVKKSDSHIWRMGDFTSENRADSVLLRRSRWTSAPAAFPRSEFLVVVFAGKGDRIGDLIFSLPI